MQQSPSELKEKLLCALDKDYNVVDMATVIEVISILEKIHITKEALEKTRLGKYVNELRKKTSNEQLARRAKDLVKGWRKLIPQTENTVFNGERLAGGITPPGPGPGRSCPAGKLLPSIAPRKSNSRFKPASPAVSCERLASPLSLSASNSPLLQPLTKSNNLITSYAPIKSGHLSANSGHSSPIPQSLNTMPNVFKPVSPALLAVKQSSLNRPSTPNFDSTVACPKVNSPAAATNSLRLSPRIPNVSSANSKSFPRGSQDRYSAVSSIPASTTSDDDLHSSLDLAKTNPANKRLRKNSDEDNESLNGHSHLPKRVMVNGIEPNCIEADKVKASKWSAFESVRSSSIEENSPEDPSLPSEVLANDVPSKPKKRGRHPAVKQAPSDILKEKLAATQGGRFHKVKTTQQLIEDLHAKNVVPPGTLAVASPSSISDELNKQDMKHRTSNYAFLGSDPETFKTKSELMDRFLKSTESSSKPTSPCSSTESIAMIRPNEGVKLVTQILKTPGMVDREIENLLRTLPKIDPSILEENDVDEELPRPPQTIGETELDRLSTGEWPHVNGIYNHESNWRPWQETVTLTSQNEGLLHILPYVNIDW